MTRLFLLLIFIPFMASAELKIASVGVYDVWPESPFRTGELEGNTAMVKCGSGHVIGAQRSRFGSNRFGVRVDLHKPLAVSPDTLYVHVFIHKPVAGRVMLVGLGSRRERKGQNPFAEQFWELSRTEVESSRWCDAVFAVRCAAGIDIRSLVIVPDCESPHRLTEDFLFYIDDIEVNSSSEPRTPRKAAPPASGE